MENVQLHLEIIIHFVLEILEIWWLPMNIQISLHLFLFSNAWSTFYMFLTPQVKECGTVKSYGLVEVGGIKLKKNPKKQRLHVRIYKTYFGFFIFTCQLSLSILSFRMIFDWLIIIIHSRQHQNNSCWCTLGWCLVAQFSCVWIISHYCFYTLLFSTKNSKDIAEAKEKLIISKCTPNR